MRAVQTSAAKLTPEMLWSLQPRGPISPAVVQPTTGTPAKRRAISAASASRSNALEQKKSTSARPGCARPA